jgi:hypothetical protein
MERDDPSYKGQRGYNRFLLGISDPWVLGFMARAVWHCPIPPVVERYRRLLGRRHLDVGPGTGYFLDKAAPPEGRRSRCSTRTRTCSRMRLAGCQPCTPPRSRRM